MSATALGVQSLSMISYGGATSAISSVDAAIQTVDTFRATLGAKINRMTSAADNLANISMNTAASRSRVEDADYAQATTELARTQIIQQAATAMLAQANQQPQAVLSLLR
jgi:flagellin